MDIDTRSPVRGLIASGVRLPDMSAKGTINTRLTGCNGKLLGRVQARGVEFEEVVSEDVSRDFGVVEVGLEVNGTSGFPAADKAGSKKVRGDAEFGGGLDNEVFPGGHVLLEFAEAEEGAVEHPGGSAGGFGVAGSAAEDDALGDDVLSGRNKHLLLGEVREVAHDWLRDSVLITKVFFTLLCPWTDITIDLECTLHGRSELRDYVVQFLMDNILAVAGNEQYAIDLVVEPVCFPVWSLRVVCFYRIVQIRHSCSFHSGLEDGIACAHLQTGDGGDLLSIVRDARDPHVMWRTFWSPLKENEMLAPTVGSFSVCEWPLWALKCLMWRRVSRTCCVCEMS